MMSLKSRRRSGISVIAVMVVMMLSLSIAVPANADPNKAPSIGLAGAAIRGEMGGLKGGLTKPVVDAQIKGLESQFGNAMTSSGQALGGTAGVAASASCFAWCSNLSFDWLTNLNPFGAPLGDVNKHLPSTYAKTTIKSSGSYSGTDMSSYPNTNFTNLVYWKVDATQIVQPVASHGYVRYDAPVSASHTSDFLNFETYYRFKCVFTSDIYKNGVKLYSSGHEFWTRMSGSLARGYKATVPMASRNSDLFTAGGTGGCAFGPEGSTLFTNDVYPSQYQILGFEAKSIHNGSANPTTGSYPVANSWFSFELGAGSQVPPEGVTYQIRQECVASNGVVTELLGATSTGLDDAVDYPSCVASGKGTYAQKAQLIYDNHVGNRDVIWEVTPDIPSQYSGCDPALTGGVLCKLEVTIDGQSCVMGDIECKQWTSINKVSPDRVECKWGSYSMPIEQCNKLERAYGDQVAQRADANVDGNPATGGTDYAVNPIRNLDGTQTQITRIEAGLEASEGSSGFPTSGSQPSYDQCLAKTWSWNPVDWVAVPVSCSINEAFVPKQSMQARLELQQKQLETKLQGKGIAPAINAFSGTFDTLGALGSGDGCKGPHVNFPLPGGLSFDNYPLDACAEPMRGFAAFGNAIASLSVVIFGGLAIIRAIGRGFGFEFGMGGK
jgi:hypothetical protein